MDIMDWHVGLAVDNWMALPVSGSRPMARYKHAAVVVGEKLYISGGSRNGRYLSDVQVFDLRNLVWSSLRLGKDKINDNNTQELIPATSGHSMIAWGSKLLLIGGHSKQISTSVTVRFIDLETSLCGDLETSGDVPRARGGHSATLVGSKIIIFGGEDFSRQILNDVHVLDLETMVWSVVGTMQTPPAPRFDHSASLHADRYLLIFGGCSHATCFNDLHMLDLLTMEWSQPEIRGDSVSVRAGHAGVCIDDNWYIVGGGDNRSGSPETLVLNTSKLVWSVATSVKERDALASEGLSLCSALLNGEKYLISFGGYNGKYNNDVFVMRPRPRDSSQPKIYQSPAAAAAAASVTAAYALSKSANVHHPQTVGLKSVSQADITAEIDAYRKELTELELLLNEAREENSTLLGKLDEINGTYAELSKERQSVQGQLITERTRCLNLEAQIAEMQKMLASFKSIEDEVQSLRSQKSIWERDMELASAMERQGSGGIWKWMSGST
uniref:Acyl-CoA-binding domain-containing protein n=1 Tax=Kalanchoe fedtschenkoi TaxID=63787 RepID=A0A7N0TLY7_KALFE